MLLFFAGVITGCVITTIITIVYSVRKAAAFKKLLTEHLDNLVKLGEEYEKLQKSNSTVPSSSIKDTAKNLRVLESKLSRLQEIGQRMMVLSIGIQQPSKNQTHSLYKNSLIQEIKELEKERDALIEELWESGFNPDITVINGDGSKERIPLRKLLEEALGVNNKDDKKEGTKDQDKKNHLKLVKDDEES